MDKGFGGSVQSQLTQHEFDFLLLVWLLRPKEMDAAYNGLKKKIKCSMTADYHTQSLMYGFNIEIP